MKTRNQKAQEDQLNATCKVVVNRMPNNRGRQIRFDENVEEISPETSRGRSRTRQTTPKAKRGRETTPKANRGRGGARGGKRGAGSSRASHSRDQEVVNISSCESSDADVKPNRRRSSYYRYDDYDYYRSRRDHYDDYGMYHHRSYRPHYYRRSPSPYRYRSRRHENYRWSPSPSPPTERYHRRRNSPSPQSYRPTTSRATKRQADCTPNSAKRAETVQSPSQARPSQRSRSIGTAISPKLTTNRRTQKVAVDETPTFPAKRSQRANSVGGRKLAVNETPTVPAKRLKRAVSVGKWFSFRCSAFFFHSCFQLVQRIYFIHFCLNFLTINFTKHFS